MNGRTGGRAVGRTDGLGQTCRRAALAVMLAAGVALDTASASPPVRPSAALRAAVPAARSAQDDPIAPGAKAPAVVVNDLDGRPVDLGRVIGTKPVVLEFWATWCSLCEELMPRMKAAKQQYGDKVAFYGVNVTVNQSKERVRRYLAQHQPPFVTLYDDKGASARAYHVPTTSFVVIIDRAGKVTYTGTGGQQDIAGALAKAVGT
ncbi:MAG: TlpA disulfide reductase family protein [Gemmatimonadales bacterium]|nr:TlpA disulfide reductase family protein [Gemmatimonadales bacterium]